MQWLPVRGLEPLTTRADFFLQICDAHHPQAHLIKDPDFNLLLGFSKVGGDAWTPTLTVDKALTAFWTTPDNTRGRRGRRAQLSTSVAVFAYLVLDAASKFTQEGTWSDPYRPFLCAGCSTMQRWKVHHMDCL